MPRRIRSSWILGAFRFVSATDFPDQHLSVPPVDAVLLPAGITTVADPNNENDQDVLPMGRVKSMGLRLGGKWDGLRLTGLPWDTWDTGRDRSTIGCVVSCHLSIGTLEGHSGVHLHADAQTDLIGRPPVVRSPPASWRRHCLRGRSAPVLCEASRKGSWP